MSEPTTEEKKTPGQTEVSKSQPKAEEKSNLIISEGRDYFNLQAWKAMEGMARVFVASGAMPKHITNGSQLMVIMQTGRELGMMPMESITSLYIVGGRVAMQSQAMLTKILAAGIKLTWLEETEKKAMVKFEGLGRPAYTASFTIEEAQTAGLLSKFGPWKQYPKNMLRWRALAFGARIFCPDVIQGLHSVEELANVNLEMKEDGVFEVATPPGGSQKATPPAPEASKPANTPPQAQKPAVAPNNANQEPSAAQLGLLIRLLNERGMTEDTSKYTKGTISARIDEVKKIPITKRQDPPPGPTPTAPAHGEIPPNHGQELKFETPAPSEAITAEVVPGPAGQRQINLIKTFIKQREPELPEPSYPDYIATVYGYEVNALEELNEGQAKIIIDKMLNNGGTKK